MELYPRMWKIFDIKIFLYCRFAVMGWAVLVLSFAIKQVDLPPSPPLGFPSNEIILTLMFLRIDGTISKCCDCKNWTYEDGLRSRFQSWTKCVILCGQFETQGQISDSLMVSSLLMIIYITKFFWTEAAFWSSLEIANDRGKYICFQHIDLLRVISHFESLQKSGQSRAILLTCLFTIVY
jgi:hypothetical protein